MLLLSFMKGAAGYRVLNSPILIDSEVEAALLVLAGKCCSWHTHHCKKCGVSERPRGAMFSCFHCNLYCYHGNGKILLPWGSYPGASSYTTYFTVM